MTKNRQMAARVAADTGWAGKVESFFDIFGNRFVIAAMGLFVFIFGTLCVRKYLSYGYSDFDLANDVAVYWNSAHGRLFYNPFLGESVLAGHFYAFALLVLPVFALVPHAITVLLIQVIFLALPAWPLYRLAREMTREATFSTLLAFFYLIYPCIGFNALWEAHFDTFTILFFVLAFLFFEREKFWPFILSLLMAVSVKENASFVVFMFGPYAFLRRRSWRWVLAPSALGFLWFVVVMKWLIPSFANHAEKYPGGYLFGVYYKHFGNTMFEVIKNVFLHPVAALRYCLAGSKSAYPVTLLAPTGGIFLFSPLALLMTVPIFAQNLLSSGPTHSLIYFHYTSMIVPFVFVSFIHGYRRLMSFGWTAKWRGIFWVVLIVFSVMTGFLLKAPQLFVYRHLVFTKITDFARAKDRLISRIPPEASVMASFQFTPKLARRMEICTNHFMSTGFRMYSDIPYEPPAHLEYAVFDFNEPLLMNGFWRPQSPGNFRRFFEQDRWGAEEMINDVVLFKKNSPGSGSLVSRVASPRPQRKLGVYIGGVELIGLDVAPETTSLGRVLRFVFYWKRAGDVPDLGLVFRLTRKDDTDIMSQAHLVGYRAYPPSSWIEGEPVRERYALYIPADVPAGDIRVKMSVFSAVDGQVIPFTSPGETRPFNVIELGDILVPDAME